MGALISTRPALNPAGKPSWLTKPRYLSVGLAAAALTAYVVLGRHDMNNPSRLPEEYFDLLQVPSKRLDFFEESGHGMIWQEPDRFHDLMIHTVLPETYGR
jgi:pimeloyl-ACP methyl ester carboxylesterase